jgi:RNA polymerase sigma factor (TIGR02999 family)
VALGGGYTAAMSEVTQVLQAIERGDPYAAAELLPLVYDELRQLAAQKLAQEKPGQTLDATALVHEAYLRLVGADPEQHWDSRGHFFAAAAEAMRRILVENARRKGRIRHGGVLHRQDLQEHLVVAPEQNQNILALDAALAKLAMQHPLKSRLVELRFFAGLSGDEAAHVLGISPSTADRDWAFARAWLRREMEQGGANAASQAAPQDPRTAQQDEPRKMTTPGAIDPISSHG